MKRVFSFSLLLVIVFLCHAAERVTVAQLQSGWQAYNGRTVCITTPLVVCGTYSDSVILAPERLYVPEERAEGLADGDSAAYFRLAALNRESRICLQCPKPYSLNLGAVVRNLTAQVTGTRRLTTGRRPAFRNYKPSKRLPDLGKPDVVVCAANIQNYFVHLGGYASANTTPAQHALQCYKVASALLALKADLYALCELEKGSSAPAELTNAMNALSRNGGYTFVNTLASDGDTISVGFIYNLRRLRPYGELLFAAPDRNSIYAQRFLLQGFEHVQSGERFVLSLNHLRSKRGTPEESLRKRMANVDMLLSCVRRAYADSLYTDPDLLILGDFNSYAQERPVQAVVRAGYADQLLRFDSLSSSRNTASHTTASHTTAARTTTARNTAVLPAYTYSFNGECGALDRVFASPSMEAQITAVAPVHWNTDFYWSAVYWSKYNFRNNTVPNLPSTLATSSPSSSPSSPSSPPSSSLSSFSSFSSIVPYLSSAAKRNLLFRYSDHDPLLIGIRFRR